MYGIGVDIIDINRIAKSVQKTAFLNFVYGEREQAAFCNNKIKINSLAANFAAKEAFSKALGTGVRDFSLNEVEALRDELGKPFFYFSGRAKDIMTSNELTATLSLSHEKDKAIAFVVLNKIKTT